MPASKPTLYCIVAINVLDTSIGPACIVDQNRITGFFKKLTDFIELPYKEIQIDNKNFTVDGVKAVIKSINPGSNDIVVFAYSGHGFRFRNDTGMFPQLGLFTNEGLTEEIIRENTINLEEIFNLVRAKGARLNIVLGDCCNNELSMQRFEVTELNLHSWPTEWKRKNCSQLFEKEQGSYLAAAASKGQLAACNKVEGGFFTFSFFQFLESAFEAGNTGLGGIIDRAAEFASLRSGRAICGDKPCMQNALSRIVS
jgi:hypothetical protein